MRSDKYQNSNRNQAPAGNNPGRKKRKKGAGKGLLILIIILAVLVAGGGWYTIGLQAPETGNQDPVVVEIPSGTGASAIVEILNEAGLVKNLTCAKINTRISRYSGLQANTYIFNKGMTFQEIMGAINTGAFEYVSKESVEVRDGARLQQVAESFAEQIPYTEDEILAKWSDTDYLHQLIDKYWFLTDDILDDDVMFPLEGYLYADTYFITSGNDTIESLTEMCLDRMDAELTERKDRIEASGFSVHEFLTLTSIVTKEARADDQAAVAGVFMNRLDQGISLGSDVTVCYIFQEDRVALKVSQLESDNPYNTRKFTGLPPGPISTVIGSAMDAVLDYEKSDNLFFFADGNGVVHFFKDELSFEQGINDIGLLQDDEDN